MSAGCRTNSEAPQRARQRAAAAAARRSLLPPPQPPPLLLLGLLLAACSLRAAAAAFDPSLITLPPGFKISLFAKNLHKARSLALSTARHPGGETVVYVSSRDFDSPATDKVWALVDRDGDGRADSATVVLAGRANPNGIAWREGSLYVGLPRQILRLDGVDRYALAGKRYGRRPAVVFDALPDQAFHESRYLAFGPSDGKLYFGIGTPCDVCSAGGWRKNATAPWFKYGSLYRMSPDGTGVQRWASGLRNSVGFDFHPRTGQLYFTDNAADVMGDNKPDDKLGRAHRRGLDFGFPFCHTGSVGGPAARPRLRKPGVGPPLPDPGLNPGQTKFKCSTAEPPLQALGPHVAPLGMRFYRWSAAAQFPRAYADSVFVAEHGSGGLDNTTRLGYRVARVVLNRAGTKVEKHEVFAGGWLQREGTPRSLVTGRPVDLLQLGDGSLLISDDYAHCVYRVTYEGGPA